jgi:hypothetical protein
MFLTNLCFCFLFSLLVLASYFAVRRAPKLINLTNFPVLLQHTVHVDRCKIMAGVLAEIPDNGNDIVERIR